jgi:hypothetical protein
MTAAKTSKQKPAARQRVVAVLTDDFTRTPTDAVPPPATLLQQADRLIVANRQKDYGDKLQNFSQIAMIWQGILATKLAPGSLLTAEDVTTCMIGVKLARLAKSPDHFDSILDVAGYAGCYHKLQEEREAGKPLTGATYDARAAS